MTNRTVTKVTNETVMRMVLVGKWPWLCLCLSECKRCSVKELFLAGGPAGTVAVVLTSMTDNREKKSKWVVCLR